MKTIKEVLEAIGKGNLPILEAELMILKDEPLEAVQNKYHQGLISDELFEAYCYAWRNITPRYSSELAEYQFPNTDKATEDFIEFTNGTKIRLTPGSETYTGSGINKIFLG